MKAKTYRILEDCIVDGVLAGLTRARRHNDNPDDQRLVECITNAIQISIGEYFSFDDEQIN